jgi:PAS domain S-box-containing protein
MLDLSRKGECGLRDEDMSKKQLLAEVQAMRTTLRQAEETLQRAKGKLQEWERERTRVEEALRESEELFSKAFNASPSVLVISDLRDGRIMEANDAFLQASGFTREEAVGRTTLELGLYGDPAQRETIMRKIRDNGAIHKEELVLQTKQGRERNTLFSAEPVEVGGEACLIVSIEDVTERVAAEEELRKLASVVMHSAELINLATLDGKMIFLNEAGRTMLGIEVSEVAGMEIMRVIPGHLQELVLNELLPALRERGSWEGELQYRNLKTGGLTDVHSMTFTINDPATGAPLYLANVSQDITERKQTMERLERLNQCFLSLGADSRENIEKILKVGRQALEADILEYCSRLSNARFVCKDFTVTRKALPPQEAGCATLNASPVESPLVITDLADIASGVTYPGIDFYGMRSLLASPVKMGKETVGNLYLFRAKPGDFSREEREWIVMLARAVAIEEESFRYQENLRDFVDVASHELRHPITVLMGYSTVLKEQRGSMDEGTQDVVLDIIDHGAERLNNLITGLLDISRIERGKFEIHREAQPIVPLIERSLEEMKARGFSNEFARRISPELRDYRVDGEKIAQLMVILLENAVKYSPSCSPVEVEARVEGGEALVSVLDRGIEVSEDDRERVFDRFFQVEEVTHHSTPGMGMGLFIARNIVAAHGGRIWCEFREGGGSAFRFTIPS